MNARSQKPWYIYLKNNMAARFIGYDATMQGGLFNKHNTYTIPASAIKRVILNNTLTLHIGIRRLTITGNYTWLSPEFNTGKSHAWGGLQLAYRLQ
jgi:hypothetical protein